MSSLLFYCLLFTINVNCDQWDGFHREPDNQLPAVSWKDCGMSSRQTDPTPNQIVSSRIYSGEFAKTGEFPWFAFLVIYLKDRVSTCGGSILNEWWVLTAAHCVDLKNIRRIRVTIGSVDSLPMGFALHVDVKRIVIHKGWKYDSKGYITPFMETLKKTLIEWEVTDRKQNKEFNELLYDYKKLEKDEQEFKRQHPGINWNYDIALLKLKRRVVPVFNKTHYLINSICLPKFNITNTKRESLVIIGMGQTSINGSVEPFLKKGVAVFEDPNKCENWQTDWGYESRVCIDYMNRPENATALNTAEPCPGDSGSPSHQYYHWKAIQIGIVSFGEYGYYPKCSSRIFYTRVSLHMPWIRSLIFEKISTNSRVIPFDLEIVSTTNHLLIVSAITASIIAVVIVLTLLWRKSSVKTLH